MSKQPTESVYWDSSVFLSWAQDEREPQRTLEEISGLIEWVKRIEAGDVRVLVGGSVFETEIIETAMQPSQAERLDMITRRRNVQKLEYDPKIVGLTREIREYYLLQEGAAVPKVADATHLAYALHYQIPTFHTFDRLILGKGNAVADRPIRICKPLAPQLRIV